MDIFEQYSGVEKPDEKSGTETIQDSIQQIHSAFNVWYSWLRNNKKGGIPTDAELYCTLEETCRIVDPCRVSIIDDDEYFKLLSIVDADYKYYKGIFYSALLNTNTDKIVVPAIGNVGWFWGYGLKKGYLDCSADSVYIGTSTKGGCIVNRGFSYGSFGENAEAGIHINLGSVYRMGAKAAGGIFINHGICEEVGTGSLNGFFVNYGSVNTFGYCGKKTFITINEPKEWYLSKKHAVNKTILHIVEELEKVSKNSIDINKIEELVSRIEKHMESMQYK